LGITGIKLKDNAESILENGVNILFSEMPLNILHSVSLPPNALRKILEVFYDWVNFRALVSSNSFLRENPLKCGMKLN
jgi:hypothetical protein